MKYVESAFESERLARRIAEYHWKKGRPWVRVWHERIEGMRDYWQVRSNISPTYPYTDNGLFELRSCNDR